MRWYGYTIRRDRYVSERLEERGGFRTSRERDLAAKEALRRANDERRPGTERFTLSKWSCSVSPAAREVFDDEETVANGQRSALISEPCLMTTLLHSSEST